MTSTKPARRSYRRTQAEQSALEAEVVRTSLLLFAEGGYEALSMRRLAAQVGVAPMSLYRYFPSKAHLLRYIRQDLLSQACAQGLQDMAGATAAPESLRAFLSGFLQYWLDHRDHYWVVFAVRDDLSAAPALPEAGSLKPDPQEILDYLGELLDACTAPARLARDARRDLVEEIFCSALGFLLATLGLASAAGTHTHRLKERILDGVVQRAQIA